MVKFRKMLVENKGFTLIELLVVIAVLGILAAIAIPRLTGITDRARQEQVRSTASSLRSSVELYIAEEGAFPNLSANDTGQLDFGDSSVQFSLDDDYIITAVTDNNAPSEYTITLQGPGDNPYYVDITEGGITEPATSG